MSKITKAEDLVPFDYIGLDYAVSAYGYVSFALKIQMKEAYTMADSNTSDKESSEVATFYHAYKNALLKLDEGVIINKYTYVYTLDHKGDSEFNKGNKTRLWNEQMFEKRKVVFSEDYIVVSFPFAKSTKKNNTKLKPLFSRISKFNDITRLAEFRNSFETFYSNLSSFCDVVEKMSGNEILGLYVKIWNCGENPVKETQLKEVKVTEKSILFGSQHTTVLTSSRLPTVFDGFTSTNRSFVPSSKINNNTRYKSDVLLPSSYLFPLGIGFPSSHWVVETVCIEDDDEVASRLSSQKLELNFLIGLKNKAAIKKANDIELFTTYKAEHGYKYASWGVSFIVYGDNEEHLSFLSNLIINKAANELDLTLVAHNTNLFKSFYACLPGAGSTADNLRLSYLEVLSYLTHVESFKKGNSSGIVMVDLFGKPFVFDFWDEKNKYVEARNMVVFGPTGQGKSVTINHMLDQSYWNGDVVFIIDVGGSYRRITSVNGGLYVDSRNLTNLSFNPFLDCYLSEGGLYMPQLDVFGEKDTLYVDFMTTLLISCYGGLPEGDKAGVTVIKKSIVGFFDYVNNSKGNVSPCFDEYYAFLKTVFSTNNPELSNYLNIEQFLFVMEKYCSSEDYGFLLNAKETFNPKDTWITFDLEGVNGKDGLAQPTFLIVMNLFEKVIKNHFGKRIRMFIDEAVDFLKGSEMGDYIGGKYRKIRKQGGQICIITQSIDFLDDLDPLVRSSILNNSEIKLLLNHAKVSGLFDKMKKELSLTNSEMELLKNQTPADNSYRIGFMKFGTMKGFLFRMEISPKTYALYQTNADEIAMIDSLLEKNKGNVEVAVSDFVEDKFGEMNDELN